jgi:heat shock protein HtpX
MSSRLHAVRNLAKATLLLGGSVVLLTALGWWLGGWRLATIFCAVALFIMATIHWYGPRIVLTSLGASELPVAEAPLVPVMLERLSAAAGLAQPKLYVVRDEHPRSLTVGRSTGDAGIAVSRGLLTVLTTEELEGVLANALAQIRHRDVVVQTPVVVLAVWLLEASRIGGVLARGLLVVLAPIAASLVHLMLSPKRVFAADARAAAICGSPHRLADALLRLEQGGELVAFRASPATEPLYVVNPFGNDRLATMFRTHPPIGERVARLRNLDPTWRETLRAA